MGSVLHYVDYQSRKSLLNLEVLVSGQRLAAVAAFAGTSCFGRHNTLVVWDWRSGRRVLVCSHTHLRTLLTPRLFREPRVVG